MTGVEFLGPDYVLPVEQKGILAGEDAGSGTPANEVTAGIAADRCKMQHHSEQVDVEQAAGGHETGSDKKRIAGEEETHEQSRFGKDNCRHAKIPGPLYECGKVGQIREKLA